MSFLSKAKNVLVNIVCFLPILLYSCGQAQVEDFESLNDSKKWNLVFHDAGTDEWNEKWFLDGKFATIENTEKGMSFAAGSEAKNHSHHAVLWTKESFDGDIKIEYNYTRTDTAKQYTTLLYIQATGGVTAGLSKDISEWNASREIPYMNTYFDNMNLIHISYAAYGKYQDGSYYVRARKYPMSVSEGFHAMLIPPSYDQEGYVNTGQTYHITAIKTEKQLFFKMESEEGSEIFTWDLTEIEPVTEGRVGLRHMYTRSAIYHDLKIYSLK